MKSTLLFTLMAATLLAQGGFRGPGRYHIQSVLSRKVLDMDRNDQRTVIQFENRGTDNQIWDITDAGGGYFYVRNAMNGNALSVQDNRNSSPLVAVPFNNSPEQQWRFESGQDTTAILVNRNGKAVDIPYGSTNNGQKINAYIRSGEENQRWQFEPAGASNNAGNNRYDRTADRTQGRGGRGGSNRYDQPGSTPAMSGQRDADGMYYDDRDRTYKMDGDGICLYRDRDFRGEASCISLRNGRQRWNAPFTDIGSVKFFGRTQAVQVFDREQHRGNAVELTGDERDFARAARSNLRSAPQSIRIY